MHMVIRAIVFACNQEEALELGKKVFTKLTEGPDDSAVFDYFTTFDKGGSRMSGEGRYGKQPAALPLSTMAGMRWLAGGLRANRRDFLSSLVAYRAHRPDSRHMAEVLQVVNAKTPREIFEGNDSMFGYYASLLQMDAGSSCWLYDQEAEPLKNKHDIQECLAGGYSAVRASYRPAKVRTKEVPADPNEPQAWIVPADVHHAPHGTDQDYVR